MLGTVIILAVLAFAVWFWIDSTRAREAALASCNRVCREANVQFLDATVQLAGLRVTRDTRGRLGLQRRYLFEFSTIGHDRHRGQVALMNSAVEFVRLEHPGGPFIITAERLHVVH